MAASIFGISDTRLPNIAVVVNKILGLRFAQGNQNTAQHISDIIQYMITYVEGTIIHKGEDFVIMLTGGIGYQIFLPQQLREKWVEGDEGYLWTHHAQSESSSSLYGFQTPHELFFFKLLLTVSGIGPKTALTITSKASVELIQQAVLENNAEHLTKVSGIGKKNAEKIVLELRDKIKKIAVKSSEPLSTENGDLIDALLTLGYSHRDAQEVLQKIPSHIVGTENKIREAFRLLSSQK